MSILAGLLILQFIFQVIAGIVLMVSGLDASVNTDHQQHPSRAVGGTLLMCISMAFLIACGSILGAGFWN